MNSTSFTTPTVGQTLLGNVLADTLSSPAQAYSTDSALTVVNEGYGVMDLIVNNLDDGQHPFHLHVSRLSGLARGACSACSADDAFR